MNYLLDRNPAGFYSLKKKGQNQMYHTVLPLGMDEIKAVTGAQSYLEENDPGAVMLLENEKVAELLATKIPFKAHKGEPIGHVLKSDPDYISWIKRTYSSDHAVIGKVVAALEELTNSFGLEIKATTSTPRKSVDHFGDIEIGSKVDISFKVTSITPANDVFRLVLKGENGERYLSFGNGKVINQINAALSVADDAMFRCSAVAKRKSLFKGESELQIQSLKLIPTSYFGLSVNFKHSANATVEFLNKQLHSYLAIQSHLVVSKTVVRTFFFEKDTNEGISKLKMGRAVIKIELVTDLSGNELINLVRSNLVERHDGLLGINGKICSLPM